MTTKEGRKLGPRPATKDRLRKKKPVRIEHQIVDDNTFAEALAEARKEMDKAEAKWLEKAALLDDKKGPERTRHAQELVDARTAYEAATEQYEQARDDAAEHTSLMIFVGVSPHKVDILKRQHPPTDEDREKMKAQGATEEEMASLNHSPTTFPPALIAMTLADPKLTEEEVTELIWESGNFNEAECMSLVMAATRAQGSIARVDLGPTFGAPRSASNSNGSQTTSENPAPSS